MRRPRSRLANVCGAGSVAVDAFFVTTIASSNGVSVGYVAQSIAGDIHRDPVDSPHNECIAWRILERGDDDAFGFEILIDGLDAALTSHAGTLHAAERHHVAVGAIGIHPDGPYVERLRHTDRTSDALRPNPRYKPVGDVIADQRRLFFVFELDDGQ